MWLAIMTENEACLLVNVISPGETHNLYFALISDGDHFNGDVISATHIAYILLSYMH